MDFYFEHVVLIANIITGIGACLLNYAHYLISKQRVNGFLLSACGALVAISGSIMLGSWPVVFLDFIWCLTSLYGFFKHKELNIGITLSSYRNIGNNLMFLMCLLSVYFLILLDFDNSAWVATCMYLFSFFLYSYKKM